MQAYLESISADSAAVAAVVAAGRLDAPVPSCPGWDLRLLAEHLGYVQRWARLAAATCQRPDEARIDAPPAADPSVDDGAALAAWLQDGATALVSTLADIPGDAATWHPFTVPQVAAVWPRRQAHEVAVHRWDAEATVGPPAPMVPALAADFVHEYFEVIAPRVIDRDGRFPPAGLLTVVLADVDERFDVRSGATSVTVIATDEDGTADRLVGTAEEVLLALWQRAPLAHAPAEGVAATWLAFGGN